MIDRLRERFPLRKAHFNFLTMMKTIPLHLVLKRRQHKKREIPQSVLWCNLLNQQTISNKQSNAKMSHQTFRLHTDGGRPGEMRTATQSGEVIKYITEKKKEIWLSPIRKRKRSDSVLWQKPEHLQKNQNSDVTTQKRHQDLFTQQIDLGRSVGVTMATKLVWLNRFTGTQPSH